MKKNPQAHAETQSQQIMRGEKEKKTQERARRAGGRRTHQHTIIAGDNTDMHSENFISVNLSHINIYRTIHGILQQK